MTKISIPINNLKVFFLHLCLIFLFSYPLFYIAYKYYVPDLAIIDYYQYQKMIEKPMNLSATYAQWVTRQLPTCIAALIKKLHIYYHSPQITYSYFKGFHGLNSQQNYFSFLLSNYLAYLFSVSIMLMIASKQAIKHPHLKFLIIAVSIGYFIVPTSIITASTHAYGWLASSIFIFGILRKKYLGIIVSLIIAMLSRETIFLFLIPFIFFTILFIYLKSKEFNMYLFKIFLLTILFALSLYIFRYYIVESMQAKGHIWGHDKNNLSLNNILDVLSKLKSIDADFAFQVVLSNGVLFYLLYKINNVSKNHFWVFILSYLSIFIFYFLLGAGNNIGRLLGESFPILIILSIITIPEALQLPMPESTEKASIN